MKLLLTSGGITNRSLSRALFELVAKRPADTSLAFVPTAANVQRGDKGWLIDDLLRLKGLHLGSIDLVDISALDRSSWLPRVEQADVLYFGGGNRYHLMEWLARSGLALELTRLLRDKVYVGMSGGSMVTAPMLNLAVSHVLYEDDLERNEDMPGLGLVDFIVVPHLNHSFFRNLREETVTRFAAATGSRIYALDDSSGVKVDEEGTAVVGEGTWRSYP